MTDSHYRPHCRPLDRAAERHYLKLARAGDESAKDALVRSLLPYVIKLARSAAKRSRAELGDLVQAGSLGLVEAIVSFDLERGTRLITHAHYYILRHIRRELRAAGLIHVPSEIAIPPSGAGPISERSACALAALRPTSEFDERTFATADHEPEFYGDEIERLQAAIDKLPRRQRRVVLGWMAGKTFPQMAARYRASKQVQHHHYQAALKNLRAMLAEKDEPREAAA